MRFLPTKNRGRSARNGAKENNGTGSALKSDAWFRFAPRNPRRARPRTLPPTSFVSTRRTVIRPMPSKGTRVAAQTAGPTTASRRQTRLRALSLHTVPAEGYWDQLLL
jgi:hypothetical protein